MFPAICRGALTLEEPVTVPIKAWLHKDEYTFQNAEGERGNLQHPSKIVS